MNAKVGDIVVYNGIPAKIVNITKTFLAIKPAGKEYTIPVKADEVLIFKKK